MSGRLSHRLAVMPSMFNINTLTLKGQGVIGKKDKSMALERERKMKKTLAVLLALIISVSFIPMSLASESEDTEKELIWLGSVSKEEAFRIMEAQAPYLSAYEKFEQDFTKMGKYPDAYAGVYFKGEEFHVKMVSSEKNALDAIHAYFGDKVIIESAAVSYNKLLDASAAAEKLLIGSTIAGNAWIDVKANEVVLILDADKKMAAAALENSAKAMQNVRVEYTKLNPPQTADYSWGPNKKIYYYGTDYNKAGSFGAWAKTSNNTTVIVGCGHASVSNYDVSIYLKSSQQDYIGKIGLNKYYNGTYADCAYFVPVNCSIGTGLMPITGENTSTPVAGSMVYRKGWRSEGAGVITRVVTITTGGIDVYKSVEADYGTKAYESGGAVVDGNNKIVGIQTNGYEAGPSYYSQWVYAKSELGLSSVIATN